MGHLDHDDWTFMFYVKLVFTFVSRQSKTYLSFSVQPGTAKNPRAWETVLGLCLAWPCDLRNPFDPVSLSDYIRAVKA